MATLEQFIREGKLGPIALGSTVGAVIASLNAEHELSPTIYPIILKYGSLQLSFQKLAITDIRLYSILLRLNNDIVVPSTPFPITDVAINEDVTLADFRNYLACNRCEVIREVESGDELTLIFASGVQAVFQSEKLDTILISN